MTDYTDDLVLPALVFVYGTLKKGFGNNRLLVGAKSLGEFTTAYPNFIMSGRFNAFPYVSRTEENGHFIKGELYLVESSDMMDSLDCLEGHPEFYRREKVKISNGDEAYMYMVKQPYGGHVDIDKDNTQTWD